MLYILHSSQIMTFAVNYVGHPFNNSIAENKGMYAILQYSAIGYCVLVLDPFKVCGCATMLAAQPTPRWTTDWCVHVAGAHPGRPADGDGAGRAWGVYAHAGVGALASPMVSSKAAPSQGA